MHAYIIPPADRTLGALSGVIAKAAAHCEAKGIRPEALLTFRLFPDMFPLTRQVQLACDFSARAAARLAGQDPRSFRDEENSFPELLERIGAARSYIGGFAPADYDGAETRVVTLKMRGEDVTMTGLQYFTLYALPQIHFHATTAYNILRHNGVEIGKRDYMGA